MDFAKINDRDTAEAGTFCHFWYPTPDSLMMDGAKPVGANVRGMESFTVRKTITDIARQGIKGEKAGLALTRALVIDFVGIERDGKPLTTSDADLKWLFDRSAKFERQIMTHAESLGNDAPAPSEP